MNRQEKGSGCKYQPAFKGKDGETAYGSWRIKFSWTDDSGILHVHNEKVPGVNVNKTVAGGFLKDKMAEAKRGELLEDETLTYETMREALIGDYRDNGCKSLHTTKSNGEYIYNLHHLDKFFAGKKALSIRPALIAKFKKERLRDGAGNCSVNRALQLLRRMFSIAVADGKYPAHRVPNIRMLKEPPARKGFIKYEEFLLLRQALPEHLRSVATLGFKTGMRLGEILGLRFENVDLDKGLLRLEAGETKNDEARTVPLIGELPDMLKILRQKNTLSEYVFTRDGQRMQSFRKAWNTACIKVGLGELTPRLDRVTKQPLLRNEKPVMKYRGRTFHDLRRCGVSNLLQAGVDPYTARKISGHKTESIFGRYNITIDQHLKDAGAKLEAYYETISQRRVKAEAENASESEDRKTIVQ